MKTLQTMLEATDMALLERLKMALAAVADDDNRVWIAYSGGVDSRFLAFAARHLGFTPDLVHISGAHIARSETERALERARAMGLDCTVLYPALPSGEELARAGRDRCYVCKKAVFSGVQAQFPGKRLCDGSNASDAKVFRPGVRALRELGVASPLCEAGLEKSDIRRIAARLGMAEPDQPSKPCLLTRFAYGVRPGAEQLAICEAVETQLESNPETRSLAVRLRYPDGEHPVLHVARASLAGRDEAFLSALCERLKKEFAPALDSLTWQVLETLSGYYDRAVR